MSRRNQDKGRIEGPFVPMLVDTMASPAWKAMSPYARVVYYTLKSRYGHKIRNNGRLGVEGKGKATHWRLTELGYMHEPPTRDFLKWDGEMFHEQKSPAYYKRQKRSLSNRCTGF